MEVNIKESADYFGLTLNQVNDDNIYDAKKHSLIRSAMNQKIKVIRTFKEFEDFIKHVNALGNYKIYLKNTKFVASDFEEVKNYASQTSLVRYRYGYGAETEVYDVDKLHEVIEVR